MARNGQTTAEKARAIATTANWLADGIERMSGEPADETVRAIEAAYQALQVVSEGTVRNQICAFLSVTSRNRAPHPDRDHKSVRGFIAAFQSDDVNRIYCTPRAASDQAIAAALDAWQRQPGKKKRGGSAKWEATAVLLQECGFGYVEPASLRKAWDRRNK